MKNHHQKPISFPKNWEIGGREVRIIEEGKPPRLCDKKLAIEEAKSQGEDLVQIARPENAPAVCKITTVGKLKYEQEKSKKKEKTQKTKEIGLHSGTDEHDVQTKMRHAKRFFEDGHRVLFKILFRGREKAHKEIGVHLLERIAKDLETLAKFDPVQTAGPNAFLRAYPKTNGSAPNGANGHNGQNHHEKEAREKIMEPAEPQQSQ